MSSPWLYALTVGPLGFYLWVLALWQSGRSPRVVRGLVDFGMLAFGVGGLLAFGPLGQFLTRMLFPHPGLTDRLAVAAGFGLWACLLARRSLYRVVIYHVDAERLIPALDEVLIRTNGRFVRTLNGFEDKASTRGLRVEFTRWLRCAVIEAHGRDPEGLIQEVRPLLQRRLSAESSRSSSVALGLYVCSTLVMVAPLLNLLLTQPRTRAALRVLIERLKGG